MAWHYSWLLDSTHSSLYGFQRSYGNVQFLDRRTLSHEAFLMDECGTKGGDGFGLKVNPVINTSVITVLGPDYYNTGGCGHGEFYHQDARQVWLGGVARVW